MPSKSHDELDTFLNTSPFLYVFFFFCMRPGSGNKATESSEEYWYPSFHIIPTPALRMFHSSERTIQSGQTEQAWKDPSLPKDTVRSLQSCTHWKLNLFYLHFDAFPLVTRLFLAQKMSQSCQALNFSPHRSQNHNQLVVVLKRNYTITRI